MYAKPIPEIYHDKQGHRCYVLERGEKCYLILDLDSRRPYRVMERIVKDSPQGLVEQLLDNQKYQSFGLRQLADIHFMRVEKGAAQIMED